MSLANLECPQRVRRNTFAQQTWDTVTDYLWEKMRTSESHIDPADPTRTDLEQKVASEIVQSFVSSASAGEEAWMGSVRSFWTVVYAAAMQLPITSAPHTQLARLICIIHETSLPTDDKASVWCGYDHTMQQRLPLWNEPLSHFEIKLANKRPDSSRSSPGKTDGIAVDSREWANITALLAKV